MTKEQIQHAAETQLRVLGIMRTPDRVSSNIGIPDMKDYAKTQNHDVTVIEWDEVQPDQSYLLKVTIEAIPVPVQVPSDSPSSVLD